MVSFDALSREFALRRNRATPLQALTTLNDPAAIEAPKPSPARWPENRQRFESPRDLPSVRPGSCREQKEVERLAALPDELKNHQADANAVGRWPQ